ncbi:MAG: transposase [Candidatus Paceibacterota bacterium]
MSIRKVKLVSGEYYHIYNRGNSKQKIFHDEEDYLRFIALMYACNQKGYLKVGNLIKGQTLYDIERGKPIVSIGAYCLMPNHFHMLITQTEDEYISNFMQKLSTSYSMYYNKKYKRTGSLFEGKFKSEHIDKDRYFKYLFSYVHLNPIKLIQKDWKEIGIKNKKEAIEYLDSYKYSSYLDFIGEKRIQNIILNREAFPKYFPNKKSFIKEIFEWLGYDDSFS